MKALKNESVCYTDKITVAIAECYQDNVEPSDAELMTLYSLIGQYLCSQGEKAFVVHLAQHLTEQLKGFSPRNLRRMRNFYRTYENSPLLMKRAQMLNWTQNAVILECCETKEQRNFYLCLVAEHNLSKLALLKAIESDAFESASMEQPSTANVATTCDAVGNDMASEAADTTADSKTPCRAFMPACKQLRQGSGMLTDIKTTIYSVPPVRSQSGIPPPCTVRLVGRGKPPDNTNRIVLLDKKKSAPPFGRTLHSSLPMGS